MHNFTRETSFQVEVFGLACTTSQLLIFELGLARTTPCLAVVEVVWQWCFAQQAAPQRAVGLVAKAESQTPSFGQSCCKKWQFWQKMKMCRNFCHHRHSPAFLLGNRHLADDLRIHIQSLAGTGSPGQSIFVQVLCGKIVVIGPIRIGRLFIKLTIVIDIFIIPSSSKRCPPPVRLVF